MDGWLVFDASVVESSKNRQGRGLMVGVEAEEWMDEAEVSSWWYATC